MDQPKFFKGCLPEILLGPLLNTLTQVIVITLSKTKLSLIPKEMSEIKLCQ